MKHLSKIITGIAITLLVGCAAGVNFQKMSEDRLTLGKTTKTDVLASMGKPNGKGTNTFNGVELEIVTYAYAKVGGSAALPGVTPARSQGLLFKDGVLVGKEYTSSFEVDSTLFDTDKAKAISKGQTKDDVIAVMGLPLGEYLFPIIDDQDGYAFVYMFTQTKGFKSKSDLFVVEFDSANVVTKTKLSSAGQL
ncbi:MAG: outer membrane protein assembly factor BamE (lipoprotein component of BamABCDE complex) [Flavobacteriales bacterium]|jgi:outer membrane protein assembly factor BamE (lipoprotein component of BamABCDE complex)